MITRGRLWLLCSIGLVATIVVYAVLLAPLEAVLQARGHGIVPLELAWSQGRFDRIVGDWGAEGVAAAQRQILWDFAFIPSYAAILWSALRLAGRGVGGRSATVPRWAAGGVLVAAGLDCVENVSLLRALDTTAPSLFVSLGSACASAKFALLLVAVVGLVWALAARAVARRSGPQALVHEPVEPRGPHG